MHKKPIVLTGMMGTGKSAIGKMLAENLGIAFYDSDKIVEDRGGLSINEIFELYGEEKFRDSETKVILELLESAPCVIATGGGALTTPAVLAAVKEKSTSIWLQTDIPILLDRLKHAKDRPLLQQDNPESVLEVLLKNRTPLYTQTHHHIPTHENDMAETLSRILSALSS